MKRLRYRYPIIVRMDDICPTMDMQRFEKYRSFFDGIGIKPLLGIVPDNRDPKLIKADSDPNFPQMIKQLVSSGWQISMHGVYHQYIGKEKGLVTQYGNTEFAGLSYDEQYSKLKYGKECMEEQGFSTEIFMPPSHSYDLNTLKALHSIGFKYLTDGRSSRPYELESIICVPASPSWKLKIKGLMTICVHSNEESDKAFEEMKGFLQINKENIIPFNEGIKEKIVSYKKARKEEKRSMFWTDRLIQGTLRMMARRS